MGFFDKIVKTVSTAANTVGNAVQDVAKEVENVATDIGKTVVAGANEVEDFGENSLAAMKNTTEDLKDEVFDLEEKFTRQLTDFINDNEAALKRIGAEVESLVRDNVNPPYQEVSQMIRDATNSREAHVAMEALSRFGQVQNMNDEVQSIGPFKTWSFQLGVEANFIAGVAGNIGYATPIFASSSDKTEFLLSGDIDVGPQFGVGGGLAWGWWNDSPTDLTGVSYCVGLSVAYYAGLGITGYWNPITGYFQGFTLEFILAGVGVEGAAGFSFSSTGSNYEAIAEAL